MSAHDLSLCALACASVTVPQPAWWLNMLQISVPVASALGLALLGYRIAVASDLRAKGTEARLKIERRAIEETQSALMSYWLSAAKLLRFPRQERAAMQDLTFKMQDASAAITVGYSRLMDRNLADDLATWHYATSLKVRSSDRLSADELTVRMTALSRLASGSGPDSGS